MIAQLLNQASFLIVTAVVLGGALIVLIARRARRRLWLAWLAAVAIAAGVNLAMRTTPERVFASAEGVQQTIASGKPTLVEFYSNY